MTKTPAEGLRDYNFPGIRGKAVKPCDHTQRRIQDCQCRSCRDWRKWITRP